MPITFRDYQIQCHDNIIAKLRDHTSTLVVMATGLGKTPTFAKVIHTFQPKRALVLAHRAELIYQAKDRIEEFTGLHCGIEMSDWRITNDLFRRYPVVIATVQTMISGVESRRMTKFRPQDFGLIVIDETHHATSQSYQRIINYFKQNPDIKILGVTATPDRADEEALGQVFESVAFEYGILDGIENGWLVDITQQFCSVRGIDLSHVKTTAGDLNGGELAEVMEAEENIQGICHPSLEVLYGLPPHTLSKIPVADWGRFLAELGRRPRRTIIFTASVKQAEACCNIINRTVPHLAEWVCGSTHKPERANILERFSTGKTAVVVNCGVLTEGFDNPAVEVIIMARPTKSRSLYAQMVGRSTRPIPGLVDPLTTFDARLLAIKNSTKPYARIIDFVGNSGKHKLITCFDILGGRVSEAAAARAQGDLKLKGNVVRVCRELSKAEVALKEEKRLAAERARRITELRRAHLIAKSNFVHKAVNPFDKSRATVSGDSTRLWTGKGPSALALSEKQQKILRRAGHDPARYSLAYGKILVGKILDTWFPKRKEETNGNKEISAAGGRPAGGGTNAKG